MSVAVAMRFGPQFEAQAEEAVLNGVREGVPRLFLLVAPQGTGKSALALRLYRKLLEEQDVVPVVLRGGGDLAQNLERHLVRGIDRALYEWVKRHRRVEKPPHSCGINDVRQLSYVLEAAGLRLFLIVDEAHLVDDIGKLMERLRALEEYFAYAGVLLMFQDLRFEEVDKMLSAVFRRGGSRLKWDGEVLTTSYLLPRGDVLDRVEA